jgi:hypothetical protein
MLKKWLQDIIDIYRRSHGVPKRKAKTQGRKRVNLVEKQDRNGAKLVKRKGKVT